MEDYLKNIYYNPANAASLSGPDKLYEFVKKDGKYDISKYRLRKWLQRQEPYSLQRPYRRPATRTSINVEGIDAQWSADLMDMVKFAKYNDGYAYLLVAIDVFSRFLWLRPLKNKKGESVAAAFEDILKQGRRPRRIRTDKGMEFRAKPVQTVFKKYNIRHFFALNEVKASLAERVIKTVKAKIYRFFLFKQSYDYVHKLQDFAKGYNKTVHRTIGIAPVDVNSHNTEEVRLSTYFSRRNEKKKPPKQLRFRFKKGDHVRITHLRNVFSREYDERWTGEIFTVSQRFWRENVPIYRLKDYNGDDILGTFYQSELQRVDVKETDMWKIEKRLKTRGRGVSKQYYVKWLHWPAKFNSWVKASEVTNL